MSIPDAAIESAAEAMGPSRDCECTLDSDTCGPCTMTATAAVLAAMPAIREALAHEVMTTRLPRDVADGVNLKRWFVEGVRWSAEIVRGGAA